MSREPNELEHALREGGEQVTSGRIRVDSARALSRLRDFRFAEPAHWVLEVLRCAALSGAKKVTVRTDADDVEVSFAGRPLPAELMKHLLEQALNVGPALDEQRARLLALGVAGALGMNASFVTVASGGVGLTLRGDTVEVKETSTRGTHLHLRKAFGWRVATAFLRGSPEGLAVQQRALRFPGQVLLNGKDVVRPAPFSANSRTRGTLSGEGWTLEVALPSGDPQPLSTLELDVAGVLVAARTPSLPGLQLHACLRADGLRRNASGSDVVDSDPMLADALAALRKRSLELLAEHGASLAVEAAWRAAFIAMLRAGELLDVRARPLLEALPLIPGPAGELATVAAFHERAREEKRVFIAATEHPEGSYPTPAALLTPGAPFEKLLPPGKRVDVAPLVEQRAMVAQNRARHARQEVEPAELTGGGWLVRGPITGAGLSGEVGFKAGGNGASVRVLHYGKLLASGDLPTLAPLRLRAVIDWSRPLGDDCFDGRDETKVFSRVHKAVEQAAISALCAALPNPALAEHALDLLQRLVVLEGLGRTKLPQPLLDAPLFPCVDGSAVSLTTLFAEAPWHYVGAPRAQGLLNGERVLVLSQSQRELLRKLDAKKLDDVSGRLLEEQEVRRRLEGPKRAPVLSDMLVTIPFEGAGATGQVGVPNAPTSRLRLTLLRSGVELETTDLGARYRLAAAIVEAPGLSPNTRWTGVTRDGPFNALLAELLQAQRRLIPALVTLERDRWTEGGELFLVNAVARELSGFDPAKLDEVQRVLASARLFHGARGRVSLLELQAQVARTGHFYVLPPGAADGSPLTPTLSPAWGEGGAVPEGLDVLFEPAGLVKVLGEALGVVPEDGSEALRKALARQGLQRLPTQRLELPPGTRFEARVEQGGLTLLAGLGDGAEARARVVVVVDGRRYVALELPCALPLEVVLDAPLFEPMQPPALSEGQRSEAREGLAAVLFEVLRHALEAPSGDPEALRALLLALGSELDVMLPPEAGKALRWRELFPCTDGQRRSADQLGPKGVQYVLEETAGLLPNRQPIVVAHDPLVRRALARWPDAVQVDEALRAQRAALQAREAVAPLPEIASRLSSPYRRPLTAPGLSGEVLLALAGAGSLELFYERRPLCVVEGVLPASLAAAIDSPRLTPTPDFKGVVRDAAFDEVLAAVKAEGERLAQRLATEQPIELWRGAFTQLAFWIAENTAWEWKGKKKPRAKKKGKKKVPVVEVPAPEHPLLARPLLRANDGSLLSIGDLVTWQRAEAGVDFTGEGGAFVDEARRAWWPRGQEAQWAEGLGVQLRDVTAALQRDQAILQRPRFTALEAPVESAWREPVSGASLEGQVALTAQPQRELVIEVVHRRRLLERWTEAHPVGGVARVESSRLVPNEGWTQARRDAGFRALVAATEAALERLVVRRLNAPGGDPFARAALAWRTGQAGPLGAVIPGLALFHDLHGREVTVGQAQALAVAKGRVPLARRASLASAPPDTLILADSAPTREALEGLGLEFEDVTASLKKDQELEQSLVSRRLQKLAWTQDALVRSRVATDRLTGELALATRPLAGVVTLARDGIAIQALDLFQHEGVVGVLDVKHLVVSDDWKQAELTHAQRDLIREEVARLFGALAAQAPELPAAQRELAASWALRYLAEQGLRSATQVEQLAGVSKALVDAPLFTALDGARLTLRTVATEVVSQGRALVVGRGERLRTGARLVLATSRFDAPWLDDLEAVLGGRSKLWRVTDSAELEQELREADPDSGTPQFAAMRFLRKELRLLRAGALGSLAPEDLEDVRLDRAGGRTALRYDRARRLVLLDPDHPDIARALSDPELRPERLWVLLAALFGLINRELDRVTDDHELRLLMALAGHLAVNAGPG